MSEAGAARHAALSGSGSKTSRAQRQDQFLKLVRGGRQVKEAVGELGISIETYRKWRKRFPEFRAQIDELRLERLTDADAPYEGDFISHRLHFFGLETYWHQREIVHAIESAKPQEIVLVLVPPEHGKTTLLEDYVCYRLGNDPDHRFLYVSEGQARTRKILGRIQRRMTDHAIAAEFIARFGPFYMKGQERQGKPWSADYFTLYKAGHDERDFSFEGLGWRSAVAGTRTDTLLVDDIQSRRSLNLTDSMVETFRQDFLTRPGRTGRTVIVGTRVGLGDFYERIQDEGIVDRVVSLPAMDDDGRSLCPELWPAEDLAKKREKVGEVTWWRNYQQKPQAAMDATFTEDMLEDAHDISLKVGKSRYPDKVAGLDPAITGGNALTVWSYDATHFELVDMDRVFNAARVEEILVRIERMAALYAFQDLVVEDNSWQHGLSQDERLWNLSRTFGFRIKTHVTGSNKLDDTIGVGRMPTSFLKGEIAFPGANAESRERVKVLVEELGEWRADIPTKKRRQDCVMSMWFAWLFWQERRAIMGNTSRTFVRSGLPYAPTAWQTRKGLIRR